MPGAQSAPPPSTEEIGEALKVSVKVKAAKVKAEYDKAYGVKKV